MARTDRNPRQRLHPDARRDALLMAAAEEFANRPYSEVTVSMIASGAGASDALLYRYFAGKEALYAALLDEALTSALAAIDQALADLPTGSSRRDRVQALLMSYLDQVSGQPLVQAGFGGESTGEPAVAIDLRRQQRTALAQRVEAQLGESHDMRHEYAVRGFLGFLVGACGLWVDRGCPTAQRWPLIESALGALEGALGDWAA